MYLYLTIILTANSIMAENINHVSDFKWNNRVLVIVENGGTDLLNSVIENKKKLEERDFVVVLVRGKKSYIYGQKMSAKFTKSVFRKIKYSRKNHSLFLIGKDGEVKHSYSENTYLKTIFSDVDRMPMRKYEMLLNTNKN